MKILFFYKDAMFNGGVPDDIRELSRLLSLNNEVTN